MRIVVTAIAVLVATPVLADLNRAKTQIANALAKVVSDAAHCSYAIDQIALEKYYVANELDNAEALAHIAGRMSLHKIASKPDESACTMSKATARRLGILRG